MSEFGKVKVTSTLAERSSFRALSLLKLYTGLKYHINSEFRQTFANLEGATKTYFREKRVSKFGRLTVLVTGLKAILKELLLV